MGHAPQRFAKAASERIRSGLSPKTIKNSAALLAPTPNPARRVGDVSVVSRARCRSCVAISSARANQRRGQRPQGVLCGGGGRVKATWPEGCTARQQALSGEAVEGFSHHRRRVDADRLQRVHRRGARLHGGIPRDFELPDHLDGTIRGLWRRGRLARQHRSGGGLGVDPGGLAGDAAQAPVRSIHFHNTMPRSADRTRKAHAIAAGAFDAERLDPPVGLGPREEGLIAA